MRDDVANWLEIKQEEAEMLVSIGALRTMATGRMQLKELVRFIEKTDWLRRRASGQLRYLKERSALKRALLT